MAWGQGVAVGVVTGRRRRVCMLVFRERIGVVSASVNAHTLKDYLNGIARSGEYGP